MLAGLAMKWTWRARQEAAGQPTDQPNMVLGSNVQVVWEKFCRYWDVEPRYAPVARGRYVVDPDDVMARVDENTIGVIPILGTTFTGEFEPIRRDPRSGRRPQRRRPEPTCRSTSTPPAVASWHRSSTPHLEWDFRLPQVKSINVSGHKYGLTYPGVGFVVWRSQDDLPGRPGVPRELPRRRHAHLHPQLLASRQPDRRPVLQLRAARASRATRASWRCCATSRVHLSAGIAKIGGFEVISDGTGHPGARLHGGRRLTVHRVPRVGPAAHVGLAGARLHDARRRHRRRRPAHRRAGGVQHGPGRRAPRRAAQGGRAPPRVPAQRTRRPPPGSATPERRSTCAGDAGSAASAGTLGWWVAWLFMVGSFAVRPGLLPALRPEGRSRPPSGSPSWSARCSSPPPRPASCSRPSAIAARRAAASGPCGVQLVGTAVLQRQHRPRPARQPRHRGRSTGWSGRPTSSAPSPSSSRATSPGWSCAGGLWADRSRRRRLVGRRAQLRRLDLLHALGRSRRSRSRPPVRS